MLGIQDVLRRSLGASLSELSPLDRLATAWPVVAGRAMAARCSVAAISGSVVTITAPDGAWQAQVTAMKQMLQADLARVSRVPLTDILVLAPTFHEQPHG